MKPQRNKRTISRANPRTCPRCPKKGHRTQVAADAVIKGSGGMAGARSYQCSSGLWHLTSQPLRSAGSLGAALDEESA